MQSARGRLVVRDDDDDLLVEVEERLRCFCRCSAVLTSLFVVGKLSVGLISSGGNGGKDEELISYCALATMKRNDGDDGRCSHDLDDKEEHNIICCTTRL